MLRDMVPTIDFWTEPRLNHPVDIRIPTPSAGTALTDFLKFFNITHSVMISNIQPLIDSQNIPRQRSEKQIVLAESFERDYHTKYHNLEEVNDYMDYLNQTYTGMVEQISIGETYEGRVQRGIRIHAPTVNHAKKGLRKKELVFHGGQHAREWIGPAVVQYIASTLLSSYGKDKATTKLLDSFDVTIIPLTVSKVLNVDGYSYTHTKNRMWRKNRQPNHGTSCIGIDPNRNWGYKWGGGGSSANPCSETYYGDAPFAALEAKNIANYLLSRAPHVASYIDFHAYSQLWMYPFGYDCNVLADPVVGEAGKEAAKALKNVHGKTFAVGNICEIIYPASGSSVDWAYTQANVTYAYGVELRDTGTYGFLLPAKQIIPSGEETYASVLALANYILKH
ncbi:Carboxypeptidase A4 [Phlyctochytrium planicorne]|nr:Carboxypeptidase A4 [Phlyctochytrium planicorne]